jgi:hypothetical protein
MIPTTNNFGNSNDDEPFLLAFFQLRAPSEDE